MMRKNLEVIADAIDSTSADLEVKCNGRKLTVVMNFELPEENEANE